MSSKLKPTEVLEQLARQMNQEDHELDVHVRPMSDELFSEAYKDKRAHIDIILPWGIVEELEKYQ